MSENRFSMTEGQEWGTPPMREWGTFRLTDRRLHLRNSFSSNRQFGDKDLRDRDPGQEVDRPREPPRRNLKVSSSRRCGGSNRLKTDRRKIANA